MAPNTVTNRQAPTSRKADRKRRVMAVEPSEDTTHRTLLMNGTKVRFPVQLSLYSSQKRIFIYALRALDRGENAIIESPTGSGKTLGLLIPISSWMAQQIEKKREAEQMCPLHRTTIADYSYSTPANDSQNEEGDSNDGTHPACDCGGNQRIRLYFATRTHQQIDQAIKEYSRLKLTGTLKHTVLAGRSRYCVSDDARNAPAGIDNRCRELCSESGCGYKNAVNRYKLHPSRLRDRIEEERGKSDAFDMEDLKTSAHSIGCCPYYTASHLAKDADVVFTPYSYLLQPRIRKGSPIHMKGAIVILDEAHNVEGACRDAASFHFDALEIAFAQLEVKKKIKLLEKKARSEAVSTNLERVLPSELVRQLKEVERCLAGLSQFIKNLRQPCITTPREKLTEKTLPDGELELHLKRSNLLLEVGSAKELERALDMLAQLDVKKETCLSPITLECVAKFVTFRAFFLPEGNRAFYRCHVKVQDLFGMRQPDRSSVQMRVRAEILGARDKDSKRLLEAKELDTTVYLWCLSPSVAFQYAFAGARSVVLASGTLSPMTSLQSELGKDFPIVHQGEQVVPYNRTFVRAVSHGPSGKELRGVYGNRKSTAYMREMIDSIAMICRTVKGGVLCFVPSYDMLESLDLGRLGESLAGVKHILREPRSESALGEVLDQYKRSITSPSTYGDQCHGGLLFGVYRGKLSEGVDFPDQLARCVIAIGIPYPSLLDPLVVAKRAFNDKMRGQGSAVMTGDEWYRTEGFRALNQALGRCLRHKEDWGAMFLLDSRIAASARSRTQEFNLLPRWIQHVLKPQQSVNQFTGVIEELKQFCEKMRQETQREGGAID